MKAFFYVLLAFSLIQCQTGEKALTTKQENKRPNIILIMADDLGYETITANGGQSYQTPNIDKMASNGIRFNHCYAQPLCTPSRVKIMTGISNVRNYVNFGVLDTTQTTFGNLFDEAGYNTCIVGKWQLGRDAKLPRKFGFQEHCLWQLTTGRVDSTGRDTRFSAPVLTTNGVLNTYGRDEYGPQIVSDYGMDFMERSVKEGEPFLLYYPMILTHCPFSPSPDSETWATNDTSVMIYKGHANYFSDMVSYTDKIIGRINDKLEELNVKENTLILFTGDNGTDKPIVSKLNGRDVAGAKGSSIDAGTRVPLVAQWPRVIKAGTVSDHLIDFSDMLPTICDALGIRVPDQPVLDGHSFFPLLKGEDYTPRKWIYNWYSRDGFFHKKSVFARNLKYKLYEDGRFFDVPSDPLEEKGIDVSDLNDEAKETYQMLDEVLKNYAKKRLELIAKQE